MVGGAPLRMFGRLRSSFMGIALVLLLLAVDAGLPVGGRELSLQEDKQSCFETVRSWSDEQLHQLVSASPESALERIKLRDLLFFLHIPRTGGRTFHQCFLRHLLPSDQRCPRSYDTLRIDPSQPGCRLISTHDDYSLLDNLPLGMTSVVTTVRDPVDRVLSSYEFSIEVAARSLRPLRKIVVPPNRPKASPAKGGRFMNTLDIWPWKYLVPTMEKDLFARRDARQAMGANLTGYSAEDPYDAAAIAMPFREFIEHPAAHELVHNGATFQVAGLTNTSYSADAGTIRQCVIRFPRLGNLVVEVAKKRLDMMLYVGLTERQNESVEFFAKVLGEQISREHFMHSILSYRGVRTRSDTEEQTRNALKLKANFTSLDEFTEKEVMEEMLESYKGCVADLRKAQVQRRAISLQTVKPIKFSREMRKLIPANVLKKVADFNLLDNELYAHAETLFQEQQKLLQDGGFHFLKQVRTSGEGIENSAEVLPDTYKLPYSWNSMQAFWGIRTLWVFSILALLLVSCVLTRHRRQRMKEF